MLPHNVEKKRAVFLCKIVPYEELFTGDLCEYIAKSVGVKDALHLVKMYQLFLLIFIASVAPLNVATLGFLN